MIPTAFGVRAVDKKEFAMASIIVMSGVQKDTYYPLGRRTNVVGRDEALPIQILDPRVSRKHMRIRFDPEKVRYNAADIGSKHGVYINSRRIDHEKVLTEGDQIRIGGTFLLFTQEDFSDHQNALNHYKKAGERMRGTFTG